MNKTIFLILVVISFILISGCAQQVDVQINDNDKSSAENKEASVPLQENKKNLPEGAEIPQLGTLCSSEEECKEFCSNNRGQCENYCHGNKNELCLIIFPISKDSEKEATSVKKVNGKPKIEHIGIELDFYDPLTNKAGDLRFHKFTYPWNSEIYNSKVFYDYGEISYNEDGTIEREPQPVYIAPLGTKVHAITSGRVSDIKKIYSDDYTIMVIKPEDPSWVYEHEHVINPIVKIGDKVTGGQVLAEVSNYSRWLRNDGYGVLDIGILTSDKGGPLHHCPYQYLDESIKLNYFEKIEALYNAWEEYAGNSSLYKEDEHAIPGCIIVEPLKR